MSLSVLFLFFRNFLWITASITLFECYLLASSDNLSIVFTLLWTKLAANVLIGLLFSLLQPNKLYFFYNLGYSRLHLFGSALAFDLTVWSFLVIITTIIS